MSSRRVPTSPSSPTGLEAPRVAEVWAPGEKRGMRGSGYLLDGELVLTAGHVVDHAGARGCEVRPLGAAKWVGSEVVWRGAQCDAALIRVSRPVKGAGTRARLGRFGTDQRADVRAVGFPQAQAKQVGRLSIVDTEDVYGQVALLSGIKTGTLTLHVAGSTPVGGRRGQELWGGMSGAALFSGPLLVGIIILAPANFGTDRLEAVPVEAMAAEAGFRAALTCERQVRLPLEVVEDVDLTRGLLRPPYRPMPEQATPQALRAGAIGFLLEPDYRVVPFHGREQELDEHARWCRDSAGVAIRLVTGAPGAGKTRFAAELCRRQQADGSVTGFLDPNGRTDRLARLAEVSSPLLVVIDEAPSRLGEVALLLTSLASAGRRRAARILLLSREAGEWWPGAIERRLEGDTDGRLALATATLRKLPPLDDDGGREQSFLAAAAAFGECIGELAGTLAPPAMPPATFSEVLMVHLAALSTVVRGAESTPPTTDIAEELLAFALRREARYWASTAQARELGLEQPVLEAAVAVATLVSASSQEEAAFLLRAVPDLLDAPEQTVRRAARWLRDLYPLPASAVAGPETEAPNAWFRPLGPALLGEALVASVLAAERTPELAEMVMSRAHSPDSVHRALTVLNQTARRHESARNALERAFGTQLRSLWQPAVAVATETGDPIGQLLARALETANVPALAVEIAGRLPHESVALREFALVAARQRLEACRTGTSAELVNAANDLALRLLDVGAHQEALETIGEALAVTRRVTAERLGLLPQLVMSLTTEWACLDALGRRSEALAPIEEAVTICRTLREREPGTFTFESAAALANQASALSDAGREHEALASLDESVRLFGKFLKHDPVEPQHDAVEIAGRLAALAGNRASILSKLGRTRDSLEASGAAVAGFRQLSELNPDAFLPRLADTLNNHSSRLWTLRRPDEALTALNEAIRINRTLAAERPDVFAPNLAGNLRNLSKRLRDVGRGQEAMTPLREAIAIYRDASAHQRGRATAELVTALSDQAELLARAGRREAALEATDEAVALARTLAADAPDDFGPELARVLSAAGGRLFELGRHTKSLERIDEAVETYRRLADSSPSEFEAELGMALGNQAAALEVLGREEQALEVITEAVDIYRRLENGNSEETAPRRADGLRIQAHLLHSLGRTREAVEISGQAVARFRALTGARHGGGFADGLARSLAQQALYLSVQGEDDRASVVGGEAVKILKGLLKVSGNPGLRFELAAALTNQAGSLRAIDREQAALSAITEAVAAYRELGPSYAYDLTRALETQFITLGELGRFEQAAGAIAEAVVIFGGLNRADESVAFELARLSYALAVAYLLVLEHRHPQAGQEQQGVRDETVVAAIADSVAIYRRRVEGGARAFLPALSQSLATRFQLLSELGRHEEALAAAEQAVSTLRTLSSDSDDTLQVHLAGALNRHATGLATVLDHERAAEVLGEAVELDRVRVKRAGDGPGEEQAQADLSFSLNHLAQQLAEIPRHDEALAAVTQAAGIRRRLAGSAPETFVGPLVLSLRLQSSLLSKSDRAEEALSVAQEAVVILREPGFTDDEMAAAHLAGALDRLAVCLGALGQRERAVEVAGEAVELDRRRLAHAAGTAKDETRTDLTITLRTLARLLSELSRHEAAIAAIDEALSVIRPMVKRGETTAVELSTALRGELERLGGLAAAARTQTAP